MNSPRTLVLAVLTGHWVGALLAWPGLPRQVPVGGTELEAAGWTEVTALGWFGLPVFSLGLVLLVWIIAAWLGRYPLFMGLQAKKRFRQLTPAGRGRVLKGIREGLELAALPIAFVFLLVQLGIFEAVSGRTSLPWTLGGLAVSLVTFSALPAFLQRRVEGAVAREWREGGCSSESG